MKQKSKYIWGIFVLLFVLIAAVTVITTVPDPSQYLIAVCWLTGGIIVTLCVFLSIRKLVASRISFLIVFVYYIFATFISGMLWYYFADFLLYEVWKFLIVEKTQISPLPTYLLSYLRPQVVIAFISLVTCFVAIDDYVTYGKNTAVLFIICISIIVFTFGFIPIIGLPL